MEPVRTVDRDGTQRWRVNDHHHRLDGPAYIGASGTQMWLVNGLYHRLDGPARIWTDGTQAWYVRGERHRLDGPARIRAAGGQEWWVCGKDITQQVEAWMKDHAITWPWDEETQMQFVLTWG